MALTVCDCVKGIPYFKLFRMFGSKIVQFLAQKDVTFSLEKMKLNGHLGILIYVIAMGL